MTTVSAALPVALARHVAAIADLEGLTHAELTVEALRAFVRAYAVDAGRAAKPVNRPAKRRARRRRAAALSTLD